jgi:hypothetical protein
MKSETTRREQKADGAAQPSAGRIMPLTFSFSQKAERCKLYANSLKKKEG